MRGSIADALIVGVLLLSQIFLFAVLESGNIFLFVVMIIDLFMKVASASLQISTASWGKSDQLMYFYEGSKLAASTTTFQQLINWQMWGTQFIVDITASLYRVIGSSFLASMVMFAIISLWGQYLYYLTFRQVFPEADSRFAAIGLFMWPSIVYWTAALGKDSLMLFSLGLASFSMAKLSKNKTMGMVSLLALGVTGCLLVRPHIAVLAIISMVASFTLVRKVSTGKATRKVVPLVMLLAASMALVYLLAQLLQITNIVEGQNKIERSMQYNQMDGSGFNSSPNPLYRVILAPLLLVRPFPWEINGVPAAFASTEGIVLFGLAFYQRKRLRAVLKAASTSGFLAFLLWFISLNIVFLGATSSNFGLLARERVMIMPMIIMLLAACCYDKRRIGLNRNACNSSM